VSDGVTAIRPISVEPPETKHERFLRLAPKRVQTALDALERIGKLSLPENEYSGQEADHIVCALRDRVDEVEARLARRKPQKKMFSFD
jgi:hypothetical protein